MSIQEYNYNAAPVRGLNFKAKIFIVETKQYVYIISPAKFDAHMINSLKDQTKPLIFIAPTNFHNIGLSLMKKFQKLNSMK